MSTSTPTKKTPVRDFLKTNAIQITSYSVLVISSLGISAYNAYRQQQIAIDGWKTQAGMVDEALGQTIELVGEALNRKPLK